MFKTLENSVGHILGILRQQQIFLTNVLHISHRKKSRLNIAGICQTLGFSLLKKRRSTNCYVKIVPPCNQLFGTGTLLYPMPIWKAAK
jgi:hypothetical protein